MRGAGAAVVVEREREIALLDAALQRARDGIGGVLIVEGPAGIGKTTVLDHVRRAAGAVGMSVHTARAAPLEQDFPFGVVRQLFEARIAGATPGERERLLDGAAALGAAALGLAGAGGAPAEASFGLLHGLYWLVANLAAEQPLLLVVDDAQWADLASLRFLNYTFRRLEEVGVLLVLGVRTGEAPGDLLLRIAADESSQVLALRPLTRDGSARVLEAEFGVHPAPELVAVCHAQTGGNPFLLHELAFALRVDGFAPDAATATKIKGVAPTSVTRSILLRLGALGADAIAVAEAVAILGDDTGLSTCADVAGLDAERATAAVSALQRAEILRDQPLLAFVHPVISAAIESSLTEAETSALHGRAVQVLSGRAQSEDRIVSHVLRTAPVGDPQRATLLQEHGRLALQQGVPSVARRMFARALLEPPAADALPGLLVDLGTTEVVEHDLPAAVEHLTAAFTAAGDLHAKAASGLMLARAVLLSKGALAAAELLDPLLGELGEEHRELRLNLVAEIAGYGAMQASTARELWRRLDPYVGLAGDTPGERRILTTLCSRWQYEGSMPVATALDAARRATASGQLLDEGGPGALDWLATVALLVSTDEVGDAEKLARAFVERVQRTGWLDGFAMTRSLMSILRLRQGRLDDADEHASTTMEVIGAAEASPLRMATIKSTGRIQAEILLERGKYAEARASLGDATMSGDVRAGHLPFLRARLDVAEGRAGDALDNVAVLRRIEKDTGLLVPEFTWRATEVEALVALDEIDQARRVGEEQLDIARDWGVGREIGIALRARARSERGQRRIALLSESVQTLEASPARLELAKSLIAFGVTLRTDGDRTAARAALARGADLATSCGAELLATRGADELRIAGARPRRLRTTGVDALTASERRVAEMAARGLTNREIAQALFVTAKSVEVHLTKTYRKLQIASRADLAGVLNAEAVDATDAGMG